MAKFKKYIWMAVTADEYELPLVVEDSRTKLANRLGVSRDYVYQKMMRDRKGPVSHDKGGRPLEYKIVKVEDEQT